MLYEWKLLPTSKLGLPGLEGQDIHQDRQDTAEQKKRPETPDPV